MDRHAASIRPLNARSVVLSALLGSHPPRLSARSLIALNELFGIAPGTTRTALSRMVTAGEVAASEGRYRLDGRLLDRQRSQEAARRPPDASWDGGWHLVTAADQQRQLAERRRFRTVMSNHRFGELRADTWLRPANLEAPPEDPAWLTVTGPLAGSDPRRVVATLWPIAQIAANCAHLIERLEHVEATTDWADPRSIPTVFHVSAATVRFVRSEPALPAQIAPSLEHVATLRARYDVVERRLRDLMSSFFGRDAPASDRAAPLESR